MLKMINKTIKELFEEACKAKEEFFSFKRSSNTTLLEEKIYQLVETLRSHRISSQDDIPVCYIVEDSYEKEIVEDLKNILTAQGFSFYETDDELFIVDPWELLGISTRKEMYKKDIQNNILDIQNLKKRIKEKEKEIERLEAKINQ